MHVFMYVLSVLFHWVYILDIESYFFLVNCLWEFLCELLDVLISLCLSCYIFYVWETDDLFLGTSDYCLLISPYIDDLIVLQVLIWLDQCSFIFLRSICSSYGISFALPTLFFVHIDLHFMFDIFHTSFLYISSTVPYSSFILFHHWYIHLGILFPHRYIHIRRS